MAVKYKKCTNGIEIFFIQWKYWTVEYIYWWLKIFKDLSNDLLDNLINFILFYDVQNIWTNEQMNKYLNKWTNEQIFEQMNKWTNEQIFEQIFEQ